jgi:DNA-binding MltR family transcriptional regulator
MVDIATLTKNLFEGILHQSRMTHPGVVIASTAILDNELERALKKAMRPFSKEMYKRLFGPFRPLSTFASKIVMAYALRIITEEIYVELEKIRHIRNEFAHSSKMLNFNSKEIAPKFLALKKPQCICSASICRALDNCFRNFTAISFSLCRGNTEANSESLTPVPAPVPAAQPLPKLLHNSFRTRPVAKSQTDRHAAPGLPETVMVMVFVLKDKDRERSEALTGSVN